MILLQVNCEKGEGVELAKAYNIKGYPTFILANKDAVTMSRWWGYTNYLLFVQLESGLADQSTIEDKKVRYAKNPDANTAKVFASYYQTKGDIKEAVTFYNQAAELDTENDFAYELYSLYFSGIRQKVYTISEVEIAADIALASDKVTAESKTRIYAGMAAYIKDDQKNKKLLSYIKDGHNHVSKLSEKKPKWAVDGLNIAYALHIDKNHDEAVALKKSSMKDGWQDNAGDLNSFSWWCFENKVNLEDAEKIGRRGAKLAQSGREKAMIFDTVAEIVNLRGNPNEAIELMELALKEDPESEYYKKQIEKFKSAVKVEKGVSISN